MKKYPIDRSFGLFARFAPPFGRAVFALADAALALLPKGLRGARTERVRLGNVPALCIRPQGAPQSPLPCLVYFHGGGFAFGAAPYHYQNARAYAEGAGCAVFVVDYRLAPKHPYPLPQSDCIAAYRAVAENAAAWGVDPARIAVGGDSAGGCLAAETVRAAAECGLRPRFLLLVNYTIKCNS